MGITPTPSPVPHRRPSFTWPVFLIAVGVVFMLHEFVPGWRLHRTWPLLLLVLGLLKLIDSFRPPRPPEGPRV